MSYTLANYLTDAQRLLHDSTFAYWTQDELTDYINEARRWTALVSGCTRTRVPFDVIFADTLAKATYNLDTLYPGRRIMAVLDVLLQYSSNTQYQLRFLPFEAIVRMAVWQYQMTGTPQYYTLHNRDLIILQWPSQAYPSSVADCTIEPLPLVNETDSDLEVYHPFTSAVGYYAAYKAKEKDQKRYEAEEFLQNFWRWAAAGESGMVPRRLTGR